MAIKQHELEKLIKEAFPNAEFLVKDLVGDEDHYMLEIKDASFIGKSRVEQHKMVNLALKEHLGTTLHALTVKTGIPA
ncbi:MAG: putative transcriptional regulator, BolA superfamily [Rickettsiaceae bacterium]|jgi:stress-induced morphogen|nr:putative transcriptional regulator, BolA superfamily [Rickettsiaceae bacterium]